MGHLRFLVIVWCFVASRGCEPLPEKPSCIIDHHYLLKLVEKEQAARETLEEQIRDLQLKNKLLQDYLKNLTDTIKQSQLQIAFTGLLDRGISGNNPVIFKNIITNVGNAYSVSTGIFHCPVDGLYFFSCSVVSAKGELAMLPFYQNGKVIFRPHTAQVSSVSAASDSAVVHAHAGDEIYPNNLVGTLDHMTRFTAVLLKADSEI